MSSTLVRLQNVYFGYTGGRNVLQNLSLEIQNGAKIAVIGDNGEGKTTLLHIIMGLHRPQSGCVQLFGHEMRSEPDFAQQRTKLGFVFQDADDQLFCPTVLEDVCFGPLNQGLSLAQARTKAQATLDLLGLDGYQERLTHTLSGGEKKLISLATVLSMSPEMLILDEPTTGLDAQYRRKFIAVLETINLPHLIVSHDFDFLDRTSHAFYRLRSGHLEPGSRAIVHTHHHAHPLGDTQHSHGPST
ncbi:MAG: energy-coupling factor ABC transporter ATP-binding protein [Thermodesulfobacteriota bacterium]